MIKNLNQLKRRLRPGTRLEVTGHCRPGCIGQLREVTWVNTQGVYTKILGTYGSRKMRQIVSTAGGMGTHPAVRQFALVIGQNACRID